MKLIRFLQNGEASGQLARVGLLQDGQVYDLGLENLLDGLDKASSQTYPNSDTPIYPLEKIRLLAPVSRPPSFRDFMSYELHIENSRRKNSGTEVPSQWYEIPVFYFSNPHAFYGSDEAIPYPQGSEALDCEFEWAAIIGKDGYNVSAAQATEHIAGFMLLNDWSARDLQRQEMAVGLGPAKGKDFATSIGPYLVTPDELADRYDPATGLYDLESVWRINGKEKSRNNTKSQYHSFARCIERAAANTWIRRGDVIGSGTLGNGCLLEEGPERAGWLQVGDVVELEIERLGVLRGVIGDALIGKGL